MDEPMTHYALSMNQEGADLLAWLSVETGFERFRVLAAAMSLMKIALDAENNGKILEVFDPKTDESVRVAGLRKVERPSPS